MGRGGGWQKTDNSLGVASGLQQLDDGGLVGPKVQLVQSGGTQTVHFCAGHKHSCVWQAQGPRRIHGTGLRSQVEQDEEVDTAPGAHEGQDGGSAGRCGVRGRVGGKQKETAKEESCLSGSVITEGGHECQSRSLGLVLRRRPGRLELDLLTCVKVWADYSLEWSLFRLAHVTT